MHKIKSVCHVTSAHSRYDTRIFHKECKSLLKNGYEVSLIVNDDKNNEIIEGINIVSTHFNAKSRFQRMFLSLKRMKKAIITINAEVYHLHDPELLLVVPFLKKHNKKVIFDSHEDYISTIELKRWIPRFLRKIVKITYGCYEKHILKKIDGAVVCYHWTYDRYKKYCNNLTLVFNFPLVENVKNYNIKYDSNIIAYAGNISEQWNHHNLISALNITNIKHRLILAGNINQNYREKLESINGWDKTDYIGKLPLEEVYKKVYEISSLGVALLDYIPQCKYVIGNLSNTKLFEFMAFGLPVVCTDFELWKQIIESEKCGICVNPRNITEIADAIDLISGNPVIAKQMGENGQKAILKKYNWSIESEKLFQIYKNL